MGKCGNEDSEKFETKDELKQEHVLSSMFLSAVIDEAILNSRGKMEPCHMGNGKMERVLLIDMMFAEDS